MSAGVIHTVRAETIVRWAGAAESEPVQIQPGSRGCIYIPSTFVGTAVTFESQVTVDATETGWKAIAATSITVTKGQWNILPAGVFAGNGTVRVKSTASETLVGAIQTT